MRHLGMKTAKQSHWTWPNAVLPLETSRESKEPNTMYNVSNGKTVGATKFG